MIFCLRFMISPTKGHNDYKIIGKSFMNCWISSESLSKSIEIATKNILEQNFVINKLVESTEVIDNEDVPEYIEALKTKEVYKLFVSPKYETIKSVFTVQRITDKLKVKAILYNDVSQMFDTVDVYKDKFWKDQEVIDFVSEYIDNLISNEGFKILNLVSIDAIDFDEVSNNNQKYVDESVQNGYSVVLRKIDENKQGQSPLN